MVAAAAAGERLRVLIANPAADLYGSDRMMIETAGGLAAQGCEVLVVCGHSGPAVDALLERGIEVLVGDVPVIRKGLMNPRGLATLGRDYLAALPRLIRLLRARRPDVVLVNTVTLPLWSMAARLARVPVVVHVHEAEQTGGRAARWALGGPLLLADGVIFNSQTSRTALGSTVLDLVADVRVVPNGVAGPAVAAPARDHLELPVKVLYVGRLSPRKGPDLAVAALQHLDTRELDATLTLVGDVFPGYEWYEEELRAAARDAGLTDRVHFAGFQSSVWPFLADADVVVVPSRLDESFGNTLVEAVLARRPVVASDHTGLREVGASLDAVVLVANDSAEALADGLSRVVGKWSTYRAAAAAEADRLVVDLGSQRYVNGVHRGLVEVVDRRRNKTPRPSAEA